MIYQSKQSAVPTHFWAGCICMGLAFSEASFCQDLVWPLTHSYVYKKCSERLVRRGWKGRGGVRAVKKYNSLCIDYLLRPNTVVAVSCFLDMQNTLNCNKIILGC